MSSTMKMQWIKTIMATGILMAATLPQAHAQQASGSIHGNVQNAAGLPMTSGNVKLTTEAIPSDTTKYKYDISIDQNGDFKSSGIEPGTYSAVFFQNGKTVDLLQNLKIVANQDLAANFDMTRAAFINGMTPEEKKALEEYKTKIASTVGENSKIANLNALLQQARDAIKAKDFDTAASLMQQAISARPAEAILWFTLGDAQAGQKKYDDAGTSYTKAIALNDANKKPNPTLDAAADNNLGQAQANAGHTADAAASYEAAAKAQPSEAAMYYNNEAATFFNKGDMDSTLTAADKAIAADPTRAEPYYLRGQVLIQKATVDKTGKVIAPPGCAEAYQKYLELDPQGVFAKDATDILTSMGETIHNTYKAGSKKN